MDNLKSILLKLDLHEAVEFIESVDHLFEGEMRHRYIEVVTDTLEDIIDIYCCDVAADEFDVNVTQIIENHMYEDGDGGYINGEAAAEEIDYVVQNQVFDEISECIAQLPEDIIMDEEFMIGLNVYVSGGSFLVESYLRDDDADYRYEVYRDREIFKSEMKYIFER